MKLIKSYKNIALTFTLSILGLMTLVNPVYAQEADNCIVIYGVTYCPEKTPFVIGNVVIDDATLLLMLGIFVVAFVSVVNALYLKGKILTRN